MRFAAALHLLQVGTVVFSNRQISTGCRWPLSKEHSAKPTQDRSCCGEVSSWQQRLLESDIPLVQIGLVPLYLQFTFEELAPPEWVW